MSSEIQSGLFDVGLFDAAMFDYVYVIGQDRMICVSSPIETSISIASAITNSISVTSTLKKVC